MQIEIIEFNDISVFEFVKFRFENYDWKLIMNINTSYFLC